MSGGGGHIIIRRLLRPVLESESVQQELTPTRKAKLLSILAKDDTSWTKHEECFAMECIQRGLDADD